MGGRYRSQRLWRCKGNRHRSSHRKRQSWLRVQRFADETAEEAKQRARAVISDAHVEATTIVARARREAEGIVAQATLPDATGAVADLCSVIEEFSRTSRALVDELVHLRLALAGPYSELSISPGPEVSVPPPVVG